MMTTQPRWKTCVTSGRKRRCEPTNALPARSQHACFCAAPGAAALHALVRGTSFQIRVWQALLAVPEGCLTTYGDLARRLGQPTAARAVGNAVGANPLAVLIPCHRVIRESGALGGYRWGVCRKLALLARESTLACPGEEEKPMRQSAP